LSVLSKTNHPLPSPPPFDRSQIFSSAILLTVASKSEKKPLENKTTSAVKTLIMSLQIMKYNEPLQGTKQNSIGILLTHINRNENYFFRQSIQHARLQRRRDNNGNHQQ